jgi:hypothetical protein
MLPRLNALLGLPAASQAIAATWALRWFHGPLEEVTRRAEPPSNPPMRWQGDIGVLRHQLSRKVLKILDRLGCLSFLSAFASICRMRSRVTENCRPTSSSVWSVFMPMPKRVRTMRS